MDHKKTATQFLDKRFQQAKKGSALRPLLLEYANSHLYEFFLRFQPQTLIFGNGCENVVVAVEVVDLAPRSGTGLCLRATCTCSRYLASRRCSAPVCGWLAPGTRRPIPLPHHGGATVNCAPGRQLLVTSGCLALGCFFSFIDVVKFPDYADEQVVQLGDGAFGPGLSGFLLSSYPKISFSRK